MPEPRAMFRGRGASGKGDGHMIPAGTALNHDEGPGEPLEIERRPAHRLLAVQGPAVDPEHEVAAPDPDALRRASLLHGHHLAAAPGERPEVDAELLAQERAGQC